MATSTASLLAKERTIAGPGFNRWLVPPAALAIHLCIGMAYGFSVFWKPLQGALLGADGKPLAGCAANALSFADRMAGTLGTLTATDCNWTQFGLGWMFTLFFVVLGVAAAFWGGWLERAGPRKAGVVAALCWCGGLLISAIGVHEHQLWMLWGGSGVIGGIGLGLGYISPVSTLIKWFPDRRGMATGMAIAGFGGGAMIGSPLATSLMAKFSSPGNPGVWQTFVALAAIYFVYMILGSFSYRVPASGWKPAGWSAPAAAAQSAMITTRNVHLNQAHKTPQFWLLWLILTMNVSAGIGIIGAASPMLQETFGGALIGQADLAYTAVKATPALLAKLVAVAAGFVGLLSLFNIAGRFCWASLSDWLGRKLTYTVFFVLGIAMYLTATYAAGAKSVGLFVFAFCVVTSMYGGGFASIPAYLADMFGTQFVGAIHGRILTAWSTAGIVGPVVVNYLHDARLEAKVPLDQIYGTIFYVLAGMLVIGLLANLVVRPVAEKYFMSDAELAKERQLAHEKTLADATATAAAATGGADSRATSALAVGIAWVIVGVPLAYGIWMTLQKAVTLFR
jgi:MFS family permease